jgi:hypothetical protein
MRRAIQVAVLLGTGIAFSWIILGEIQPASKSARADLSNGPDPEAIEPGRESQSAQTNSAVAAASEAEPLEPARHAPARLTSELAAAEKLPTPEEELEEQCQKELRALLPLVFGDDRAMLEAIELQRSIREMDERATEAVRRSGLDKELGIPEPEPQPEPGVRCPEARLFEMWQAERTKMREFELREGR